MAAPAPPRLAAHSTASSERTGRIVGRIGASTATRPCGASSARLACVARLARVVEARCGPGLCRPASQWENAMFKGSLVALITPMRQDGTLDEKAYAALVD